MEKKLSERLNHYLVSKGIAVGSFVDEISELESQLQAKEEEIEVRKERETELFRLLGVSNFEQARLAIKHSLRENAKLQAKEKGYKKLKAERIEVIQRELSVWRLEDAETIL